MGCLQMCKRYVPRALRMVVPAISFAYPIVEFFMPATVFFLVLSLLLRPTHVRPRVKDAVLAQFRLTPAAANATSTMLNYDIAVQLSFHNPSRSFTVRYVDLTAVAYYGGTRLGPTIDVLPIFVQRPNASNVVHGVFQGSTAGLALAPAAAEAFDRDHTAGCDFNVTVTITSTFMYRVPFLNPVYYYEYTCELRFPVVHHSGKPAAAVLAPGTACSVIR